MNFLQSIRKFYQALGVCSHCSDQTYSFNLRICLMYFVIAFVFICEIAFCRFEAESVADYGKSFYAFVTQLTCFWDFTTTIWQIERILKLIGKYEIFIAKSKCRCESGNRIKFLTIILTSFQLERIANWFGYIHWIEWSNWTHVENDAEILGENYLHGIRSAWFHGWSHQLLCSRFGRRIISKWCPNDVRWCIFNV